jgi:hypothetical protein
VAIGGSRALPDSKDCQHELCSVCHVLPSFRWVSRIFFVAFCFLSRYLWPSDNFAKRPGCRMSGDWPSQRLNRVSTDWGTAFSDQAQVRTTTSSTA